MGFGNVRDLAHDEKRSVEGIPLDLGRGRVVYVRRAGGHNRRWQYELARLISEHRDEIRGGTLPPETLLSLEQRVAAEALVARWEGFVDEAGEPIACTPATVLELFGLCPDVYDRVLELARDEEGYRLEADCKSD